MSIRPDGTYAEITPQDWTDAKRIGNSLPYRVFRGHADSAWHLSPTMERAAQQFSISLDSLPLHEQAILKGFKSRAHHYLQSPPADRENVEWLSLIREYGGPTRLLDVTWSFYVASFFAVEEATRDACVWAINATRQIREASARARTVSGSPAVELSYESVTKAEEFLADSSKTGNGVLLITPTRLSERQAIQKGAFLFPQNIQASLEQNLASTFAYEADAFSKAGVPVHLDGDPQDASSWKQMDVLKINLPRKWHREIITDLYRMNIDAASLFPGLDGFARSLKLFFRRPMD
jgi:hypothetical protein